MPQFEVSFNVAQSREPGKAMVTSSATSSMKTTVEAFDTVRARQMVEAQYGANCRVVGCRPK